MTGITLGSPRLLRMDLDRKKSNLFIVHWHCDSILRSWTAQQLCHDATPGDVEVRLHCDQPSAGLPPPELCATEGEAEAVDLDSVNLRSQTPDERSQSAGCTGCTDTKDIDIEIGSHLAACQG